MMKPTLTDVLQELSSLRAMVLEVKNSVGGNKTWMDVNEAAKYCHVSPWTIRLWAKSGVIAKHGGKKHSYDRDELDRAMRVNSKRTNLHFSKTLKGKAA